MIGQPIAIKTQRVGVRDCRLRSKGCLSCITMKVKCDQTKPSCQRCRRGGRECPGYRDPGDFVFRNEAWDPGALVHSLLKSTMSSPSTRRSPWPQTGPTWQCHISSTTSSCRRLAAILAPSSSCPDCTRQTRRRTIFEVPLTRLQWLVLPAPTIWVTGTCAEPETPISRL
jgi:hypothetical protein